MSLQLAPQCCCPVMSCSEFVPRYLAIGSPEVEFWWEGNVGAGAHQTCQDGVVYNIGQLHVFTNRPTNFPWACMNAIDTNWPTDGSLHQAGLGIITTETWSRDRIDLRIYPHFVAIQQGYWNEPATTPALLTSLLAGDIITLDRANGGEFDFSACTSNFIAPFSFAKVRLVL